MADCFKCHNDQYPNKDQTSCIPKVVVFLTYEEPLGIALAICVLSFVLVTALVLRLFVKHHDTPIVKVNNQSLTYTLLISLLLCFLSPLLHIGQPEKVICFLRHIVFRITFTMTISVVLAKTVTVVLAFKATSPGSFVKKWVRKRLASIIILPFVIIEGIICIVELIMFPPLPQADMHSRVQEIILKCKDAYTSISIVQEIIWGFLAFVTFIVAFLAQKLPHAFNEARFITFSMLVFCSLWLVDIPVFLSAKEVSRNMEAIKIFIILVSCAALLGLMFLSKCYIILWRPELNSKEQLRKWKR